MEEKGKSMDAKDKSMDAKPMYSNAFALAGRTSSLHHTQGAALGYVLVAPLGRALNACFPLGRALNACFPSGRALNASFPSGRALNACAYSLIQLAELEKYLPKRRA